MATVLVNGIPHPVEAGCVLSAFLGLHTPLETPCGGFGRCGKCRVTAYGQLSPPSAEEHLTLTPAELAQGIRLACCTQILGNCQISVGQEAHAHVLGESGLVAANAPAFSRWGAAVDIGTTTLAACLYDRDGSLLAQVGALNPQARWGADVISRIGAACIGQGFALAASVRQGVNQLLIQMAEQAGIAVSDIDGLVITGNTAMLYLLTQSDPDCLSHAPFEAERLFDEWLTGAQLALVCANAKVYLPRCFSAFVGADIATALLASGITRQNGIRLLADIGTNGEIALWNGRSLLCCSTAAGPAFEGAGLSMGMPGKDGAVDHIVVQNGALCAHVLGDGKALGLCGSGVVDALAALLQTGQMDETGYLDPAPVMLCPGVSLTQKDVRAVQLAKSAIASGIATLISTAGLTFSQVDELAVAGGFGSYLNVENAGYIGLIPQELVPCVRVLGNAALRGAAMILLNTPLIDSCRVMMTDAKTIDLASSPLFMQTYTDNMFF